MDGQARPRPAVVRRQPLRLALRARELDLERPKSVTVRATDATSGIKKAELLVSKVGQAAAVVGTKTPTCCRTDFTTTLNWTPSASDTEDTYGWTSWGRIRGYRRTGDRHASIGASLNTGRWTVSAAVG